MWQITASSLFIHPRNFSAEGTLFISSCRSCKSCRINSRHKFLKFSHRRPNIALGTLILPDRGKTPVTKFGSIQTKIVSPAPGGANLRGSKPNHKSYFIINPVCYKKLADNSSIGMPIAKPIADKIKDESNLNITTSNIRRVRK